jgi:hypothetical protein
MTAPTPPRSTIGSSRRALAGPTAGRHLDGRRALAGGAPACPRGTRRPCQHIGALRGREGRHLWRRHGPGGQRVRFPKPGRSIDGQRAVAADSVAGATGTARFERCVRSRMVSAPGPARWTERTATLPIARRIVPMYRASRERWLELAPSSMTARAWPVAADRGAHSHAGTARRVPQRACPAAAAGREEPARPDRSGRAGPPGSEINDPPAAGWCSFSRRRRRFWRIDDAIAMLRKWATNNPPRSCRCSPNRCGIEPGCRPCPWTCATPSRRSHRPYAGTHAPGAAPSLWLLTIGLTMPSWAAGPGS